MIRPPAKIQLCGCSGVVTRPSSPTRPGDWPRLAARRQPAAGGGVPPTIDRRSALRESALLGSPSPEGLVAALDVGGTSIKAGLVGVDGSVHGERRVSTPVGDGPAALVAGIVDLAAELAGGARRPGGRPRGARHRRRAGGRGQVGGQSGLARRPLRLVDRRAHRTRRGAGSRRPQRCPGRSAVGRRSAGALGVLPGHRHRNRRRSGARRRGGRRGQRPGRGDRPPGRGARRSGLQLRQSRLRGSAGIGVPHRRRLLGRGGRRLHRRGGGGPSGRGRTGGRCRCGRERWMHWPTDLPR